jgi:tetratricopeptide (TPR) repeat protein
MRPSPPARSPANGERAKGSVGLRLALPLIFALPACAGQGSTLPAPPPREDSTPAQETATPDDAAAPLTAAPEAPTPEETELAPPEPRVWRARSAGLIITEINGLESLLASTPKDGADRVLLLRRLAEDYVELEHAAARAVKPASPSARSAAAHREPLGGPARAMAKARSLAQKYYATIEDEYPSYPQLDEVLYFLAHEYELANDSANARRVYFELVQKRPRSKYVPNAYFAFGELFSKQAEWGFARDAYIKVIGSPPPDNNVYGYAWYKLALVFSKTGEFDKALKSFKKVIEYSVNFSQLPNAGMLAEKARTGMVALGERCIDTAHYPEALAVLEDLAARDPGADISTALARLVAGAGVAGDTATAQKAQITLDSLSSRAAPAPPPAPGAHPESPIDPFAPPT